MSQNPNPGFNPQAPSFVPNAGAAPFVPGQQFAPSGFYPPQQQFYQQPPGGYPQQFYGNPHPGYAGGYPQGGPPQQPTHAQTAAPVPAPGNVATSAVIEPTLPTVPKAEPLDSWDDVAEAVPEPAPAPPPKAEAVPPPSASAPPKEKKEAKRDDQPATAEISKAVAKSQPTPNLADIETRKEHLNIVFIGHVDAGKSTIGGQLMYLTGMVDKRTLEKYEREAKEKGRESWYLSWALDTNDEEREKGKTVEVGRAFFETEKKHFTILDAPGHKSFVPNMISGATQADLAVLVISARRGEFETGFDRGGQTREHAVLVKTAGVKHLIVLVNKMDDPTVCYDEARYNEVISKLTPYLRQVGFNPKTDITFIPCSGLTGAFLKDRPKVASADWYTGPCFLDYLDDFIKISRDYSGAVRMIVCDKYSDMGTIVIGKVESGIIMKGQTLFLMPNKVQVGVLQCWCDDEEMDQVVAGDNVKLRLRGVEESDILSGFVICSPDNLCRFGRVFDAEIAILEHKSIITAGYACVLHLHSAVEEVTIKRILAKIDKKTGEKQRGARFVKQGDKAIVRIESSESFCLDAFKDFAVMGRFTLRDEGKTVGIGKVLKVIE